MFLSAWGIFFVFTKLSPVFLQRMQGGKSRDSRQFRTLEISWRQLESVQVRSDFTWLHELLSPWVYVFGEMLPNSITMWNLLTFSCHPRSFCACLRVRFMRRRLLELRPRLQLPFGFLFLSVEVYCDLNSDYLTLCCSAEYCVEMYFKLNH